LKEPTVPIGQEAAVWTLSRRENVSLLPGFEPEIFGCPPLGPIIIPIELITTDILVIIII
jgi:hypothetical protein